MKPALGALLIIIPASTALAAERDLTPAEDVKPGTEAPAPPARGSPTVQKRELTPEEKAEKEARKECKKKICDIIATRMSNEGLHAMNAAGVMEQGALPDDLRHNATLGIPEGSVARYCRRRAGQPLVSGSK